MKTSQNSVKAPSAAWPILRALIKSPTGVPGLLIVAILGVVAVVAPILFAADASVQDFAHVGERPSLEFPLGTDELGRDVLLRTLVAVRLSLSLALVASVVALVLGTAVGMSMVLLRPRARSVMARVIDTMIAFPSILVVIVISVILGRGSFATVIGVGIAFSAGFARLASTLALSIGGRDYVHAARVSGVRGPRLLRRYLLPNIAEPLVIAFSLTITGAILTISALSFLGIGVRPPAYDLGLMLAGGLDSIVVAPISALAPAFMIAIAALGFGLLGEALARAFNPLLWTESSKSARPRRREGRASADRQGSPHRSDQAHARVSSAGLDTSAREAVLEVEDLVVTYPSPSGPIDVVKGVSFSVGAGEVLGIVGESGSGKTQTALAVAQLTQFPAKVTGRVGMRGTDLLTEPPRSLDKLLGTDVAFVFQDPSSSLNPTLRIGVQLTEALRVHKKIKRKAADDLGVAVLKEMHLPAPALQLKKFPHELSGGQRQRVMIGKGLVKEPSLLIADEPTTALDVTVQAQIMSMLNEVNETHRTAILLISHNLALVSQSCDRVIVMYAGRVVEEMQAEHLRSGPLHPYTRALLGALPELGFPRDGKLEAVGGEIPDVTATPSGCAFHPRCPFAIERCSVERPELLVRPEDSRRRVACHVANDSVPAGGAPRDEPPR